jgi:hypothetical protein
MKIAHNGTFSKSEDGSLQGMAGFVIRQPGSFFINDSFCCSARTTLWQIPEIEMRKTDYNIVHLVFRVVQRLTYDTQRLLLR